MNCPIFVSPKNTDSRPLLEEMILYVALPDFIYSVSFFRLDAYVSS